MPIRSLLRFAFASAFTIVCSLPVLAESHVRIVRLSYLEGGVKIDRNTGQYEKAMVNLPITEGAKLRTAQDGRVEVEFEDGATLRLGPATAVQFTKLSLLDSGGKASTIHLLNGTVYVTFAGARNDELTLQFARENIVLRHAARIRVSDDAEGTSLAVFKGDVQVESPSGTVEVKKNQTASFDSSTDDHATVAKNIEPAPLDSWDKKQSEFHERYAGNSYANYSPYAYGASDLGYYGAFFSVPGYGMLWQPYFVGAGWDPFMNGAWAFSPGFGYGWISSYPWGWTPYHYGSWLFLPGYGWVWQPGGMWMPWYSQPSLVHAPSGFRPPQPPTAAPVRGTTILPVNRGPESTLANRSGSKIVIQNNSAGLGVPRGLSNLPRVSQEVQQKGIVTQRVHTEPIAPPRSMMQPTEPGIASGPPRGTGSRPNTAPAPRMNPPSSPPPAPRMSVPQPSPSPSPRR